MSKMNIYDMEAPALSTEKPCLAPLILFPYQRRFFHVMDVYKPLRTVLFGYELILFLFLAFSFVFFSSLQAVVGEGVFPYLVYMSSNALFPLICFFLLLRPGEYRNYLPLYMAGKTIAVVLFYAWAVFSLSPDMEIIGREYYIEMVILLGGVFFISMGDGLSVFGTWLLNRKLDQAGNPETRAKGGKECG